MLRRIREACIVVCCSRIAGRPTGNWRSGVDVGFGVPGDALAVQLSMFHSSLMNLNLG